MNRLTLALSLVSVALSGCGLASAPMAHISREAAVTAESWRSVATPRDRERVRGWYRAWTDALASARAGGHAEAITREGALLDPLAALPDAQMPVGNYDCRVVKLGSAGRSALAYVTYPSFRCRIAAEQSIVSFTKLNGSQRQAGLIYGDSERRQIFLGTLMLGQEERAFDYGTDAERDVVGIIERIGPNRWRMVMPRPAFESIVDVMELVPARP
jgi:hypothetical protein